jgi:hypothetical protein
LERENWYFHHCKVQSWITGGAIRTFKKEADDRSTL